MKPAFLFAHGAGLGSASPWMQAWAARLTTLGVVRTFDYPYMAEGRRAPDRLPRLIQAHTEALSDFRTSLPSGTPVVLVGKSMGSRVGLHLALAQPVRACVCLGYPLVGVGKKAPVRREVLEALRTPVLFVQGTRDRMGPLDLFAEVQATMQAPSVLHVVESGDHSLQVTKAWQRATGRDRDAADADVLAAIAAFVAEHAT
ncbi:MAG: alpha/beta fold hydrolase [Alphaproteobacteria bacterium]|nr:alpha/beta fold hydrolase [Alphaproteobacteria bacterium]